MAQPRKLPRLSDLRVGDDGMTGAFEEFCCQLFRRMPEAPPQGQYRRIRGAGGDGGVEAIWIGSNGDIRGLQAKWFSKLGSSEKAKIKDSLFQAIANYGELTHFTLCLPFVLTGKKGAGVRARGTKSLNTSKPTTGQHQILLNWFEDWKADLLKRGRSVAIDVWDESELLGRLASADTSGGLTRYWFARDTFNSEWFDNRLQEAAAQAGPRYSPVLSVRTSLDGAVDAFGLSEQWKLSLTSLIDQFSEETDWWRKILGGHLPDRSALPPEIHAEAVSLLDLCTCLETDFSTSVDNPAVLASDRFREGVVEACRFGASLEPQVAEALRDQFGEHADTPQFRQYQAEFQASFPMAPLDHLRKLRKILAKLEALALQPDGQLPTAVSMLVHGEAGIGKTHGILDAARRRAEEGLRSIVVFGESVVGPDPWTAIFQNLGLGLGDGSDNLLDCLDAAGEATGSPLIFFIDALNETQPDRREWQKWLPPMVERIRRRRSLKLCVSCRDTYLREVIPSTLSMPQVLHNGFAGHEYEAQYSFFLHYHLGPPAEPLLQEEFSNPLFLRLFCEAVSDAGERVIPVGRRGLRFVINILLRAKNERAARACDFDPRENRVRDALRRLAAEIAEAKAPVSLQRARELIDLNSDARSRSLLAVLEDESLVSVIEVPAGNSDEEASHFVRFTFERFGDFMIAERILDQARNIDGFVDYCRERDAHLEAMNAGVIEALSILIPEEFTVELIDLASGLDEALLGPAFLRSLPWRSSDSVSPRTLYLVNRALAQDLCNGLAFEVVVGLSVRPQHPLNSEFMHSHLTKVGLLERDPYLSAKLERSY